MSAPAQKTSSARGHEPGHAAEAHRLRGPSDANGELDLLAGLWQVAPFARLPADAPTELRDYVQDVENPRRVYAIHRASRRHDFQHLVDKYIYQLRTGCGASNCATATCFTCRKRLAGKAPVRRYNPTSARTLAVYLASQDNPEAGLCPYLGSPREVPPAVNSLIFSTRPAPSQHSNRRPSDIQTAPRRKPSLGVAAKPPLSPTATTTRSRSSSLDKERLGSQPNETKNDDAVTRPGPLPASHISVSEKAVPKDYRSFAVATFGTVAFKMLEWLTPQAIEAMTEKISELGVFRQTSDKAAAAATTSDPTHAKQPTNPQTDKTHVHQPEPLHDTQPRQNKPSKPTRTSSQDKVEPPASIKDVSSRPKRNSKTTLRSSPSKSSNRRTMDPVAISAGTEEAKATSRPPSLNGFYPEKLARAGKTSPAIITRGVPEIPSKPAFFENVSTPTTTAPTTNEVEVIESGSSDTETIDERKMPSSTAPAVKRNHVDPQSKPRPVSPIVEADLSSAKFLLPQSLSTLNVELVDFICDVFQEDSTYESRFFGPLEAHASYPKPQNPSRKLARRRSISHATSPSQWKAFNEQALFTVLSDPHSLVQSFSRDGKLYDSHTLFYCMLRMTRAAPTLVLHSLWMAAESLFTAPKSLHASQSRAMRALPRSRKPLSDFEAGCVMSVCLHALVAVAPFVSDSKTLYDMSRIRSTGLVLGGNGLSTRQPASICLEYEDVFSNDIAVRLARRVFSAVSARRSLATLMRMDGRNKAGQLDILQPLLNQLDLLSSGPLRILEFPQSERLLHETRVPTLLLDWARTVLHNEWDGNPEIVNNGAFHGALSLISTMYQNRTRLLLGDIQFRADYFSERLDSMEMPVAWAESVSTRNRGHILDYPYLFSPECLITFFRSINFAKMSRMFEESSSLKTRMSAIVDPGSLVANPHHKIVLQDMLKVASSKYLILDIGRENVLRDAFDQLWRRERRELLRPLKVHLGEQSGEEGFDSGGVQQEFFRVAIAECMDPKYGAFAVDDRTRMAWFVPGSVVEEWKFELIGVLVSLAVYNGLTLPVTFPKALYRKLLGEPVEELYHIADGWPALASGLMSLLEWNEKDGQVEDIFARTYEFSVPNIGGNVTREMTKDMVLWPQNLDWKMRIILPEESIDDQEAPLVTNDNRDQYVSDYIRYLTDVSVRPQYEAFERGFKSCLSDRSLSLLSPQILQSIVEGVQEIDISELRRYTRYVGWDASHHTIRDFWSIVKRYDDRMKRKLLEFVTASDRVPVGGMRNLQFVVQRNGEGEGSGSRLPTAYTCYGTLLLPEYRDKELLRQRLAMALENAQGFGFA
ncbi:hect domain-containing [Trichoderma arundinaceum]|uniref:HECT-type E3 ubiquitin transferase n=1 Tax=Trichoderma arundinaceum TaxID=490622 RepID=A0A395P019_TRIAR|nr:hect domain-containing [Trichoderma arundinaceum]